MNKEMKFCSYILILLLALFPFNNLLGLNLPNQKVNIDSLEKKANAVALEENTKFVVKNENEGVRYYSCRILVKNKQGEHYGYFSNIQNEFNEISDIKAVIKDTAGNLIKELDDDEITTESISPGIPYFAKEVYKRFKISHNVFPYIVEYSFTTNYSSLFFWPDWTPEFSIPCLSATYNLVLEFPVKFRYHTIGNIPQPNKIIKDNKTEYTWKIENLEGNKKEDYLPPENSTQAAVIFASESFKLRDYQGDSENWKSLGQWYNKLAEGRYSLSEKTVSEIYNRLKGITNTEEKIKSLYQLLQDKSHYVSIGLGISGWQPQPAEEVYQNGYGDCKDLSTLMIAMLKAAGIKAFPALAKTRDDGVVIKDFPASQFNHCIVFVPLPDDSLWIECTAKFTNLKDMPSNIQGINALVIKDDGGELVSTPINKYYENLWSSRSVCKLDKLIDELNFNITLRLYGDQKDYFKPYFAYYGNDDDLIFLKKNFGRHYNNLIVYSYNLLPDSSYDDCYKIDLDGIYKKVSNGGGNLLLLNPNLFNRKSENAFPKENVSERKFPVYYGFPYTDIDTVQIEIPSTYKILAQPEDKFIDTDFGSYSASFAFDGNNLFYVRKFEIKKRIIPLGDYSNYREFIKQVIKADQSQFVFKK